MKDVDQPWSRKALNLCRVVMCVFLGVMLVGMFLEGRQLNPVLVLTSGMVGVCLVGQALIEHDLARLLRDSRRRSGNDDGKRSA